MIRTTSLLAFTLTTMICWVGKTQAGELEERGLAQHPIGRQVGQIGAINGPDDWCMFLPPKAGGGIAPHEVDARAFCNRKQANAPGAKLFPPGFIRSTHFVKTKTYVQITGQFNRKAYELSQKDGGGQYDMKAPVGSIVTGFKRFVNIVEPDNEIYCIRACIEKDKKLCDTFHSERGCRALIGGNYGPNQPKAVKSSSKPHRKPTRTIVETNDVAPPGSGNKDTRTRPNPTRKPLRPTPAATSDTVPTQPVTVCETETKTKTKTRTRTTISVETTTYTKHHETTLTVTKYLPPLPTDIPNFPSLPKPESPTILIRNSPPNHESRPPVVTSAVSGCHDLYPEGLLFWNTTVSTAMVFIPGDMAVRIEFYVQENCTGPSVLNLERDTLSTHRSSIVDVLPDFFGNYLGPQSVNVRVEM